MRFDRLTEERPGRAARAFILGAAAWLSAAAGAEAAAGSDGRGAGSGSRGHAEAEVLETAPAGEGGRVLVYGLEGAPGADVRAVALLSAAEAETVWLSGGEEGDPGGPDPGQGRDGSRGSGGRKLVDRRLAAGPYRALLAVLDGGRDTVEIPLDLEVADGSAEVRVLRRGTARAGTRAPGEAVVAERPAVPPLGSVAFVANEGAGYLSVLEYPSGAVVAAVETGGAPADLAFSRQSGRLFVADAEQDQIAVLDAALRKTLRRTWLRFGDGPSRILLSGDERRLFVLNAGSATLAVLDAETTRELGRISLEAGSAGLALDEERGYLLVGSGATDELLLIEPTLRQVARRIPAGPAPGEVIAGGPPPVVFVAGSRRPEVLVLDTGGGGEGGRMRICGPASGLYYDARRRRLYVSQPDCRKISVLLPERELEIDAWPAPGRPGRLEPGPDGRYLLATLPGENRVVTYSLQSGSSASVTEVGERPVRVIVPR